MVGLGLLIGIVFPLFVSWLGIPDEVLKTPWFFLACIAAGVILAVLNISLARTVVGSRLRLLSDRMQNVTRKFRQIKTGGEIGDYNAEECQVIVDSEDESGMSARVLMRLTRVAKSVMCEGDILVRFVGEEFLAILPGASRKDVLAIADRLCCKIAASAVANGDDTISATVSDGGISYHENDVASEMDLVDLADKALYMAKESGRSCVVMATGD